MSFWNKLFGLDQPAKPSDETSALLITAHGNEELAAIEALLRSAEIPYRLCDRGAGGVVRVISGYTMYGTDVFIRAEDMETAQELLKPVDVEALSEEDAVEPAADSDEAEGDA